MIEYIGGGASLNNVRILNLPVRELFLLISSNLGEMKK